MDVVTDPKFLCLTLGSFLFIVLGHKYQAKIQAPLKTEMFRYKSLVIDGWSVAHILYFAMLGWWFPKRFWFFFFFGIGWELFEDALSKDMDTKLVDCTDKSSKGAFIQFWCNGIQDDYWYGKADDVLMNVIGYIVGSNLRKLAF